MEHESSQKIIGYTFFMKGVSGQELSIVRIPPTSLANFRAIQGIPIDPELIGHILIPCNWKACIFHRAVLSASNPSQRTDSFQVEREAREDYRPSSSHHLILLEKDSDEEELHDDYTIPQKVHYHSHWKRNQDAVYWVKLSRAQDQGLQFWQTKSHATIVRSLSPADCIYRVFFSERRSKNVRKTLNPTTHASSYTQKQLAIAAAAVHLRGRSLHKETCARQDGDEGCQRQPNR